MNEKGAKIVYTTVNDLSGFGGVETMFIQEVRYLTARGFNVHVLSPEPKGKIRIEQGEGVVTRHFPSHTRRIWWPVRYIMLVLWFSREIHRMAKHERVVSVSFTIIDGAGPALAKIMRANVRTVLRVVGPFSFEVEHYFLPVRTTKHKVLGRLSKLVEAFSYIMADSVLPISEFEEANIKGYHVNPRKVKLIRCGIDESVFNGGKAARVLTLPAQSKVVMFVGRLVEKNGPLVIADAAPTILKSVPDCIIVFVGDGVLRKTIETKLKTEIASGRVVMTGSRSDIPQLHAQADVYVGHVSSMVEGLGQTVFEAMMSGLPVVAGSDNISKTIIADGVSGLLVPKDNPKEVAEAVIALLRDEQLRKRMGTAAREVAVKTLSFESMMRDVMKELA